MKLKCDKCGHEWEYKGKALKPTCPSCIRKVNPFIQAGGIVILLLLTSCQDYLQIPNNYTPETNQTINATNATIDTTNQTNITIIEPPPKPEPILIPIYNKLAVYVLDTSEKGTSIITINNNSMLINSQSGSDGLRIIKILKNLNINRINKLIVTNDENGNIEGVPAILLRFDVDALYHSGIPSLSPFYLDYKKLAKNITDISHDKLIAFDEAFISFVVSYDDGIPLSDDNSILIRLSYGDTIILFATDCRTDCESRVRGVGLKSNILVSNGHCNSLSYSFLKEVSPEMVVFSNEPCKETFDRVFNSDISYKKTNADGDILITSDGKNYEVRSLKQ